MAKLVGSKLVINGFTYVKSRQRGRRIYWDCQKLRMRECTARAVTLASTRPLDPITVLSGPTTSKHNHPPNPDGVKAQVVVEGVKKLAESQRTLPPSAIIRDAMAGVSQRVLSQLPERENLRQTICRQRRVNLPPNPKSLEELAALPDEYTKTSMDEQFVLHDNVDTRDDDEGRVIVFGTRKNVEILCTSRIWFLDGTFSVSPSLFTQLFTVIGVRRRAAPSGEGEDTPVPLIYALLEGKHEAEYERVMRTVRDAVDLYRIGACTPTTIMVDFETAILNACRTLFPQVRTTGCFFHLGQAVYRQVQALGLQARYNAEDDESVRSYTHMMLSLAFVPTDDVERLFVQLRDDSPAEMAELFQYFERYYVRGVPARGRRRAVQPRYAPKTWNQYEAVLANSHRTNNVSEGWHNRFRTLVGKAHPDIFSLITELKKEQANTEVCMLELSMGRRVRNSPARKWLQREDRILGIALQYDQYADDDDELTYLRSMGSTIELS